MTRRDFQLAIILYVWYGRLIFWYRCVRHEDATDGSKHDVRAPMQEEEKKIFRDPTNATRCFMPRARDPATLDATALFPFADGSSPPPFPRGCTLQDVARHETGD